MSKLNYLIAGATATLMISCGSTTNHNSLTPEEVAEGWELLFDGTTLNGWRDYNGEELTRPGLLKMDDSGQGEGADEHGYIVTNKIYENFELAWDWKIADGGNSGVLYHVVENPKFAVPYVTGPNISSSMNKTSRTTRGMAKDGSRLCHVHHRSEKTIIKPAGEWNNSRILLTTAR